MNQVTICIPFYNDAKFLKYSIQSVLNQTYKDWHLLLIDDGSTDGSINIARSFLHDPRIQLISDGQNQGLVFRLNQSIDLTSTKYYARMDADDIMMPDRIEQQVNTLNTNSDIDVLGSTAYSIDELNTVKGLKKHTAGLKELISVKTFIHPSIIAKTEWLKKHRYKEYARRMEDMELWYRSVQDSNFLVINKPLIFYREFGGSYYKKYRLVLNSLFLMSFKYSKSFTDFLHWFKQGVLMIPKYLLFKLFSIINKESFLISLRYDPLTTEEIDRLKIILNDIIYK